MQRRVHITAHPSQLQLAAVDSNVLLELFPFALILNEQMRITAAGEKLIESWMLNNTNRSPTELMGAKVTEHFKLRRPTGITFTWENVGYFVCYIVSIDMRSLLIIDEAPSNSKL